MRYDHFSMLPERAFQPRGPYGMTLEGGGGGIIGDIVEGIGDAVGGALDVVGDVVEGAVDIVSDVGSQVDDFVNDAIPGGWVTVAAVTAAAMGAPVIPGSEGAAAATGAGTGTAAGLGAADAITAAEWFGGAGAATSPGAIFGSAATPAGLIASGAEGMGGGTGITPGTPGVGLQQPTMPNIAGMGGGQGLTVPVDGGTVGQLGFTPAGAVPILGSPSSFINNPEVIGQPVLAQGSPEPFLSVRDALRGLNLASQLGAPQQQLPTQPIGEQATPATGVDYSGLLGLLATRSGGSGLLGTRFQPQPINLTSLLG